jgi:hypothetical protein
MKHLSAWAADILRCSCNGNMRATAIVWSYTTLWVVSTLTISSVVFGAVNVDVTAGHPNDIAYLHIFPQLEPPK